MTGLITKDLFASQKYMMTFLAIGGMWLLIFYKQPFITFFAAIMIVLVSMLPIFCMKSEHDYDWNMFVACTNVKREKIVASRYAVYLIYLLGGMLLIQSVCLMIAFMIENMDYNLAWQLEVWFGIICTLLASVMIPCIYKFGYDKTGKIMVACWAVVAAIILIPSYLNIQMEINIEVGVMPMLIGAAVALAALAASYFVSLSIYKKKYIG
ncbi:MAG: ABC-2 transporter permease [Firmicutes bacterium]|nr:ABC-2 transporter permease [Bacillota bacterium]